MTSRAELPLKDSKADARHDAQNPAQTRTAGYSSGPGGESQPPQGDSEPAPTPTPPADAAPRPAVDAKQKELDDLMMQRNLTPADKTKMLKLIQDILADNFATPSPITLPVRTPGPQRVEGEGHMHIQTHHAYAAICIEHSVQP